MAIIIIVIGLEKYPAAVAKVAAVEALDAEKRERRTNHNVSVS